VATGEVTEVAEEIVMETVGEIAGIDLGQGPEEDVHAQTTDVIVETDLVTEETDQEIGKTNPETDREIEKTNPETDREIEETNPETDPEIEETNPETDQDQMTEESAGMIQGPRADLRGITQENYLIFISAANLIDVFVHIILFLKALLSFLLHVERLAYIHYVISCICLV